MNPILSHRFPNGLTLVGQVMSTVQSVGLCFQVPTGVYYERADRLGTCNMLKEYLKRGTATLDTRELTEALDRLGVHHAIRANGEQVGVNAAFLGDRLDDALPLLMDMVLRPRFAEEDLEPCRELALQDLDALADSPQSEVMKALVERHRPAPKSRSIYGTREGLEAVGQGDIRDFHHDHFVSGRSVIGIAGRFDWNRTIDAVGRLIEGWSAPYQPVPVTAAAPRGVMHKQAESAQVHLALAFDSVHRLSPQSILARYMVSVLSGGMSGRLFTEVREKRGLCYAVSAQYVGDEDWGGVYVYAGTTPQRAQETLDVTMGELERIRQGVDADEMERARIGMKSGTVMREESSYARAELMAYDQFLRGHPRSVEERVAEIEGVTLSQLNEFLATMPLGPITMATIGPAPLEMRNPSSEVSA